MSLYECSCQGYPDPKAFDHINGPGLDPAAFLLEHQNEWLAMEQEYNLQTGHLLGDNLSIPYVPHFLISQFDLIDGWILLRHIRHGEMLGRKEACKGHIILR